MSESLPPEQELTDVVRLEDIVDKEALATVCRSFFELFGLSLRVFSRDGSMLADVHERQAICRYVNTMASGRQRCSETVESVRGVDPKEGAVVHPCFTGAAYRIVPIEYHGRSIGRFILGPYLPSERRDVPKGLRDVDQKLSLQLAKEHLSAMPRLREETAERMERHLAGILNVILFSSHRARLTSEMHVATIRESYKDLASSNQRLKEAYDRLQELDRLKSNFLATVSHELRTPLTAILGYAEMLATGVAGPLQEEQAEFVETIRSKGDHLLALITRLLDMSRLEEGTLRLHPERVSPQTLLQDVANNIEPEAKKKSIRVEQSLDPVGLPELLGDPVRLRQVLFNLADNAVKFTPEGGTVRLSATHASMEPTGESTGLGFVLMAAPRPAVAFHIQDTGIGIAEEERARIFDAFYQVDGSSIRQYGGAGLGLSIAQRLVHAHEGQLLVESTPGAGTTFTVVLPLPEAPMDGARSAP